MRSRTVALIAAVAALALATPSRAQPAAETSDAAARFHRGIEYFNAKQYDQAAAELDAAYQLDPRRDYLFSLAQSLRLGGHCDRAAPLYRKFPATAPPAQATKIANDSLIQCEAELGRPPPSPVPSLALSVEAPWYRDRIGMTLLGSATVAVATGVTLFVVSSNAAREARSAPRLAEFEDQIPTAVLERNVAIIATTTGAALATAAVLRFALRSNEAPVTATVAPGPGGAALLVEGRF